MMADLNVSDNPTFTEAESAWTETDTAATALSEAETALDGADDDARSGAEETLAGARKTHGEKIVAAREATTKALSEARKLGVSPKDWREALPEEHREYAKKWESQAAVVKSYSELEKKLGSAISIPGKDASDEDKATFWNRLGRPKEPTGYKLVRPEGLEADDGVVVREKSFAEMAHASGQTQTQVNANLEWFYAETAAIEEARVLAENAAMEKSQATLDQEWGDDKEANIEFARRANKVFGGEEYFKWLEDTKVGNIALTNHPMLVRVFANVGRNMDEAALMEGMPDDQKKSKQERLDELGALQSTDPKKYMSEAVQSEVRTLNEELYGTGDATGPAKATLK